MPEIKTPVWKTLTRAGILVGILSMLITLAVLNIFTDRKFLSVGVLVPFCLGAVLILAGIFLNRHWIKDHIAQRRFLVGLNVWAMIVLAIVLLTVANAIVTMTPQTESWFIDCTKSGRHTLSPKTRNILKELDKEVTITVLVGRGAVPSGLSLYPVIEQVNDMVALYRASSSKVKIKTVNVYRDKAEVERFALALKDEVHPDSIVLQCGDRHKEIPFRDLLDMPPMTMFGPPPDAAPAFKGEEKLTEALMGLIEEEQTVVYFTTGHGELATEGGARKALNEFVKELKRDNYRVETLNLLQKMEVPEDCDVMVIAGPTAPVKDEEVSLIRAFLEKDGKVLVLATPRIAGGNLSGLGDLLADYNVRVRQDAVVLDETVQVSHGALVRRADLQFMPRLGDHAVTEDLETLNLLILSACPVEPVMPEQAPSPYGAPAMGAPYRATAILESSSHGWGETNINARKVKYEEGKDIKGPVPLALAVESRPPRRNPRMPPPPPSLRGPRLVVIGSTWAAMDEVMSQYEGNRAFMMNCMNWLARKESSIGIPPKRPDRRELKWSPVARRSVFYITVVGMPLLSIIAGGLVWWIRRR